MALRVPLQGILTLNIQHVISVRGVFTYKRRVPLDLHPICGAAPVVRSLKTRDPKVAAQAAQRLNAMLEALWASYRTSGPGLNLQETREAARARLKALGLIPGGAETNPDGWWSILDAFEREHGRAFEEARHDDPKAGDVAFLTPVNREMKRLFEKGEGPKLITMEDARALYLRHHDKGDDEGFVRELEPAFAAVISTVGNLPLEGYTRDHALKVRDRLFEGQPGADGEPTRLSTSTVRRRLNTINAIFNKARLEHGLTASNPFDKLPIPREGSDTKKAVKFSDAHLRAIADACRALDDQRRHLVAMMSDTGARLEEIVGLRVEDVVLSHDVPHVVLREDLEAGKTLKTDASTRRVPLVGEALWGARRATTALGTRAKPGVWVFDAYASDTAIKSDSASAAIIKWLRGIVDVKGNTRSFRHSMKDRLREADVPQVIQNRILGHSVGSVGETYGEGHSLAKLREHLLKVVLQPEGVS